MAACERGYEPVVRKTRVNISSRSLAHDFDAEGVGKIRFEVVLLEECGGGPDRSPVATMLSINCLISWIFIAVSRAKLDSSEAVVAISVPKSRSASGSVTCGPSSALGGVMGGAVFLVALWGTLRRYIRHVQRCLRMRAGLILATPSPN